MKEPEINSVTHPAECPCGANRYLNSGDMVGFIQAIDEYHLNHEKAGATS